MTSHGFRYKRDGYEDLDNICESSIENIQNSNALQNSLRQTFSISDTAIYQMPKPTEINLLEQSKTNLPAGSIPCFLRLGRRASLAALPSGNTETDNAQCTQYTNIRRKENVWLICYILLYGAYLVIGSLCFQLIETPIEHELRTNLSTIRGNFLFKYPQITEADLEELLKTVIFATNHGISVLSNTTEEISWNFGQSFFFSSSLLTTIGYGHITPLSSMGKVFCIIYAAIGIPLTLVLLSATVERLLTPSNYLLGTLITKLGHLYQPLSIRLLHLSIIVSIAAIIFFVIPTAIFVNLEPDWNILDSFYYCFISLTTIGLGDYIPGEALTMIDQSVYKTLTAIYLIIGLIAMMLVLTVFYDIPQLNIGQLFMETIPGETNKKCSEESHTVDSNQPENRKSHKNLETSISYDATKH